jgi:hypothetical protein
MKRIIGNRGSGKTRELMEFAKENNAIFVCSNPYAMRNKAEAYGITGLEFLSYEDYFYFNHNDDTVVIDEIEVFLKQCNSPYIIGYSLSNED